MEPSISYTLGGSGRINLHHNTYLNILNTGKCAIRGGGGGGGGSTNMYVASYKAKGDKMVRRIHTASSTTVIKFWSIR